MVLCWTQNVLKRDFKVAAPLSSYILFVKYRFWRSSCPHPCTDLFIHSELLFLPIHSLIRSSHLFIYLFPFCLLINDINEAFCHVYTFELHFWFLNLTLYSWMSKHDSSVSLPSTNSSSIDGHLKETLLICDDFHFSDYTKRLCLVVN